MHVNLSGWSCLAFADFIGPVSQSHWSSQQFESQVGLPTPCAKPGLAPHVKITPALQFSDDPTRDTSHKEPVLMDTAPSVGVNPMKSDTCKSVVFVICSIRRVCIMTLTGNCYFKLCIIPFTIDTCTRLILCLPRLRLNMLA